MQLRHAVVFSLTASCLAHAASAQTFWVPRGNGITYDGNVGIGDIFRPRFDIDLRTDAERGLNMRLDASSGRSSGVYVENYSRRGTGIMGIATRNGGRNYGVYGTSNSDRGTGVYGYSGPGTGVHGKTRGGTAVTGEATHANGYASMFLGGQNYFERNVGIGEMNPTAKLHVFGDMRLKSGSFNFGDFLENGDTIRFQRINTFGDEISTLRLYVGEEPGVFQDTFEIWAGNSLRYGFRMDGEAVKRGGSTAWSVISDRRTKHDINDLESSLEKLMGLRGVTFFYNDDQAVQGQQIGFVAQEVEKVFPQWIDELEDGTKILSIGGFEALAVEALRELRAEKDAQLANLRDEKDAEIAELKAQNAEFAERLAALEAAMAELQSPN